MITIRVMTIQDYDAVYDLWIHTPGMGLNSTDDSREGIAFYLKRNPETCFVAEENGKVGSEAEGDVLKANREPSLQHKFRA